MASRFKKVRFCLTASERPVLSYYMALAYPSWNPTTHPSPRPRPVPCPKCKAYVPTTDMAALKFHIIGHYSSVWLDRVRHSEDTYAQKRSNIGN